MQSFTYLDDVVVRAPAKINLFLEVLGKRQDGYHEIATLMVAIGLHDTLIFQPAESLTLSCNRPELSTGPENLILRAAAKLQQATGGASRGAALGAAIQLVKRIPIAAGLAGGSTDAAAALEGLNRLWKLGLSRYDLVKLAGEIGSDVPFFFSLPAAWCTGRGEIIEPALVGRSMNLVLVCPKFGMSTAETYKRAVPAITPASGEAIRQALAGGDAEAVGGLLVNRLQAAAESIDPRIAEFQTRINELGVLGGQMSGSGSALFAICRSADEAEAMAESLRRTIPGDVAEAFSTQTYPL